MTDTLERELRRTLADHARDAVATGPDPWDRVQRAAWSAAAVSGPGRSRDRWRWRSRVGGGLAVVRPWAGGEPTQPATVETSGWGLDDGEPRGALAGDEELRAGVEQVLAAAVSGPSGTGAELVPGSLRLVFADDLAGSRLVVAVARTDAPGAARDVGSVLVGPAGAAADGLALRSTPPVPVAGTAPAVAQVLDADDGRRLVAVVPRGARISVSDAVQVDAAGTRLGREWREVEVSGDGVVDTVLDAEPGSGLAVLRIDSAAGYAADGPVAEVVLPWPGPFTEAPLVAAKEVVARGPHEFRDGVVPRPVGDDPAAQDVSSAMEVLGRPSADDVRLLYASADGADAGRGAQGWSSVVAVPAGDGSVVVWQHHLDDGGTVRTSTVGGARRRRRRAGAAADPRRSADGPRRRLGPGRHAGHGPGRRRGPGHARGPRVPLVPGHRRSGRRGGRGGGACRGPGTGDVVAPAR